MARYAHRPVIRICERILDTKVKKVEFPGGKSRKSYRLKLADGRSVIATKRRNRRRASMEATVLDGLGEAGSRVPKIVAFNGVVLVQEELPGQRLPLLLDQADESEIAVLLDQSLAALADIHQAAIDGNLAEEVPAIGESAEWLYGLLLLPRELGDYLRVPAPELDVDALEQALAVRAPAQFVKWDARPGNAMGGADGGIAWFDWEHCGRRNRLDDLVWFFGDEFVPDVPEIEADLLDKYLPEFADDMSPDTAREYFTTLGTFHLCVRLDLILDNKGDEPWWDWEYCLEGDKAGITLAAAQRLCARGQRWALASPLAKKMSPWFEEVSDRLAEDTRSY